MHYFSIICVTMLICICVHAIVCTVCGLTVEAVCSILLRLWDRRWAMRLILALRKVLTSAPFVADICPPHWGELCSRLLPDSQSSMMSQKCRLRERQQGFRVPFGTRPIILVFISAYLFRAFLQNTDFKEIAACSLMLIAVRLNTKIIKMHY